MPLKIKFNRTIAIILAVVVLLSTVGTIVGMSIYDRAIAENKVGQYQTTDADRKMAEDISDVTGVGVYQLLEMKNSGKSWNEVLQAVQEGVTGETDLTDEQLSELVKNFAPEEIDQATALVERVLFNIREINAKGDMSVPEVNAIANPLEDEKKDEYDFKAIEAKFMKNIAIYLALRLKEDFGSYEGALDEYLYSIQVEVSLTLYLKDKDEYDRQIIQKSGVLMRNKAITIMVIEQAMLAAMNAGQAEDTSGKDDGEKDPVVPTPNELPGSSVQPDLLTPAKPEDPMPKVEMPRAADPTAEVMDEIDKINRGAMPY